MKIRFTQNTAKYQAGEVRVLPDKVALSYIRNKQAKVYVEKPEKAIIP